MTDNPISKPLGVIIALLLPFSFENGWAWNGVGYVGDHRLGWNGETWGSLVFRQSTVDVPYLVFWSCMPVGMSHLSMFGTEFVRSLGCA